MRRFLIVLAILLAILHQDFWWWSDTTLVFGFMPIGLAYHALYSVLAAGLWTLFVKYSWPDEIEAYADAGNDGGNA